jgi:hypothetical protein
MLHSQRQYIDFKFHFSQSGTSLEAYFNLEFDFHGQELVRKPLSTLKACTDFKFHLLRLRTSLQAYIDFKFQSKIRLQASFDFKSLLSKPRTGLHDYLGFKSHVP